MGRSQGDEPLTLTRSNSCGLPKLYEVLEGQKSVYDRAYNLKGIKVKFSVLLLFLKLCFSFVSCFSLLLFIFFSSNFILI